MSLTMLSVRIPETMRTYLKQTAISKDKTVQELVAEILNEYQSNDIDYIDQLNQAGFASLLAVTAPQPAQSIQPADKELVHDL